MISPAFLPVEFNGIKFDRGMQLLEFDTIRNDPAAPLSSYTGSHKDSGRFASRIGDYVRSKIDVVEVPTPMMLLPGGELARDCCITNYYDVRKDLKQRLRFLVASTMSQKILGIPYEWIAAGYHRAAWLPPPMLLPGLRSVKFHYPAAGYFGSLAETLGVESSTEKKEAVLDCVQVRLAFLTGCPTVEASVLFVVDQSPIYRVTNQEMCAGKSGDRARLVVEYRGECDIQAELSRLRICHGATLHGHGTVMMPLPTPANIDKEPKLFCNTLNDQLIREMLKNEPAVDA